MFNVGDYCKGKNGAPYGFTNGDMTLGKVTQVKGDQIEVRILKHNNGASGKFWVRAEHFETTEGPAIPKQIKEALEKHILWLEGKDGGERAVFDGMDLSGLILNGASLNRASLNRASLNRASLNDASLNGASLNGASLNRASLNRASLTGCNISGAKNLISAINYLEAHFERTEQGYIVYKTFGGSYKTPGEWKIEPGSVINEVVNPDRCTECGSGINVAPFDWVKQHYGGDIWKCLIEWAWLPGVVVPYMTDGKIRCERVKLLEIVKR
jgi:uncharacterized protein YjbI with pentapeptide repeats